MSISRINGWQAKIHSAYDGQENGHISMKISRTYTENFYGAMEVRDENNMLEIMITADDMISALRGGVAGILAHCTITHYERFMIDTLYDEAKDENFAKKSDDDALDEALSKDKTTIKDIAERIRSMGAGAGKTARGRKQLLALAEEAMAFYDGHLKRTMESIEIRAKRATEESKEKMTKRIRSMEKTVENTRWKSEKRNVIQNRSGDAMKALSSKS